MLTLLTALTSLSVWGPHRGPIFETQFRSDDGKWSRLNKFYEALSRSPLYAAAAILHPALGINYLRAQWMEDEDRIPPAQNRLSTYWNKWYRHCVTDGPGSAAEYSIASLGLNVDFKKWLSDRTTGRSETDRYYDLPFSLLKQGHQDSIQWWLQKREEFLDLLAVPAMAGECEKAFNAAEVTMLHSTAQWYLGLWRKLSAYAIGFTGERLRWPASRILTQKQPPHLSPKRGSRINSQDVRSSEGCSQKKVALNLITFRIT
ncbi:hypothetical protein E4U14_006660 [Claviceps sp. LM454 group G7]|nr:hypothetical protein E4U14_006660 [Claviceps sp. LM454 group G7]